MQKCKTLYHDIHIIRRNSSIVFACGLLSFAILLSLFGFETEVQHNKLYKSVKEFKDNATYVGYYLPANSNMYVVKGKKDVTPSFTIRNNVLFVGSPGDILVRTRNQLGIDYLDDFISYYVGGHSCIIDENQHCIETTGLAPTPEENVVINWNRNSWLYHEELLPSFGLKVQTSLENRKKAIKNCEQFLGIPYNYTFFFQHDRSMYCTDVPARGYEQADPTLSFNDYILEYTNYDILTNPHVSLFYYKEENPIPKSERDSTAIGDYNIYYLDDGMTYPF